MLTPALLSAAAVVEFMATELFDVELLVVVVALFVVVVALSFS